MADIHVQTKKHNAAPSWLWILIVLIVLALVVYFVTSNKPKELDNAKEKTTGDIGWYFDQARDLNRA